MARLNVLPGDAGLTETRPGHNLGIGSKHSIDSTYAVFECSCGYRMSSKLRKTDGRAGAETQRTWERHLELADADPNVTFEVGTVTIKKGPKRIFVAPQHWVGTKDFLGGGHRTWVEGSYSGGKGWGVFSDAKWCREVLEICDTKEMAFTAALRLIDIADKRGSKVNRQCDALNLPDSETARTVLAALLGLNIATAELGDMATSIAALDEVIKFMPLLQQKHQQLVAAHERALLAPLLRRAAS